MTTQTETFREAVEYLAGLTMPCPDIADNRRHGVGLDAIDQCTYCQGTGKVAMWWMLRKPCECVIDEIGFCGGGCGWDSSQFIHEDCYYCQDDSGWLPNYMPDIASVLDRVTELDGGYSVRPEFAFIRPRTTKSPFVLGLSENNPPLEILILALAEACKALE